MGRYLSLAVLALALGLVITLVAGLPGGGAAAPHSTPPAVVINEVAWGGTAASAFDEWIELHNPGPQAVDLAGWTLSDGGDVAIPLAGPVAGGGYFLLERSGDDTVSDVAADRIYTGGLHNDGERLELRDAGGALVDVVDGSSGWPAGSGSPGYYSLERIDPLASGGPGNWADNDGLTRCGLDAHGNPLNGTPRARNSATPLPGADLRLGKMGPAAALPGAALTYTLSLGNGGQLPAQAVWLTDVLPAGVQFVTHSAPYPLYRPAGDTLLWQVGDLPTATAAAPLTFTLTVRLEAAAAGPLTNVITASSSTAEANPADNHADWVTIVGGGALPPVVIDALHYDGYELADADEALRLWNVSGVALEIGGWRLSDGSSTATLPAGAVLAPGQAIWCARQAAAFARQFGFAADYALDGGSAGLPALGGTWPGFANHGDECLLLDGSGQVVDALVYGDGNTGQAGWLGPAILPWTPSSAFGAEGQILYRKRDQATGRPLADTGTAADWAQDPHDHLQGRRALYPGWNLDAFFFTQRVTQTAVLTVAVAPDHLYETVSRVLAGARERIQIESYTFQSRELAELLLDRIGDGVEVTLLLEGAPAVEGVTDQEKWIARRLHDAGAQVLFMINDAGSAVYDRYRTQHAKLMIVDDRTLLVGSENPGFRSLPADDKANGTGGQRGVYLITDAPGVVARARAIFEADADPAHHADLADCAQVAALCSPPAGFQPVLTPDWLTYTVRFPQPFSTTAEIALELIQAPENSLRDRDGLLGLLARAGPGDTILVEMFYEYQHWGPADGTPQSDPNPRLEALVEAARRGAAVRILLDRHFDAEGKNAATVAYLAGLARTEHLDLEARLGDPTGLGLHNKMVLARIGGQGYIHAGSINGSESSSKLNRELVLQVQSQGAYDYLRAVFDYDWGLSTPPIYLPLLLRNCRVPRRAEQPLISEVYYAGSKEQEWVEIVNPGDDTVDLTMFKIGDAARLGDYEGMYRFPSGTTLAPQQVLVVASSAAAFSQAHAGRLPDFELYETNAAVPNLSAYLAWGLGEWHLANDGDEVLLLDRNDRAVDALVYGEGRYVLVIPHPGVSHYSHSLERYPYLYDSDDCSLDFRDWPFPNPGELP